MQKFEFLHWFEGIVVSGTEKTRKPFADIYKITLDRYRLDPKASLFIDDNKRNIEAAQALGIQTIHFENPKQLASDINSLGINL